MLNGEGNNPRARMATLLKIFRLATPVEVLLLGLLGAGVIPLQAVAADLEPTAATIEFAYVLVKQSDKPIAPEKAIGRTVRFSTNPIAPIALDPTSIAQASPTAPLPTPAEALDLDPTILEASPLWQHWVEEVPDVLSEIRTDPSFRPRLRLGYAHFPDAEEAAGFYLGVEDILLERSGFTVSGDYQRTFEGDREIYGADLRYYIFPLGSYVNLAPVVGYRSVEMDDFNGDGLEVGLRVLLALSRTGAADLGLTQTWVSPGEVDEVGITTLSLGYALTRQLRLSTDLQRYGSPAGEEARLGLGLEWMF